MCNLHNIFGKMSKTAPAIADGGGFYDRYLCCRNTLKIGICYDFQLIGEVPSEAHDVRLDAIVTDARVLVRESSEVL